MMDAQVQCGLRRHAPRVPAKMVAVLAVAVLLLCSSVQSFAEDVQATITQVRASDLSTSTTPPAITTTTEGSSDTHSAVLANAALGEDDRGPLVLVDLARADQENMTTMATPSPPTDAVPAGFDMNEFDDADAESLAASAVPPSTDSVPAGFDMNEFDDDSQSLAATQDEGTLLDGYPAIGNSQDNSHGPGYGVKTYGSSTAPTEDDPSFASTKNEEDPSLAASQDEGTLVDGYPAIGSSEDNSQGRGYGVKTYGGSSTTAEDDPSFASHSYEEDPSLAATQDEGTLVEGYPVIGNSVDNSQGTGYGVRSTQTNGDPGSDSFAVYDEDIPDSSDNIALATPRTYRPMPPKPAPAEAWRNGRCTYYGGMDAAGTMSGACGYGNLYASGYGVYTAALSAKLFNNGLACGACYEIACSGKGKLCKAGSIVVTATNFCPPNPGQSSTAGGWCNLPNEHFDLSYPAFSKIADPRAGVVPLQFRRVPCKKLGGIRFTLSGNCNFNLVTITNVGASGVVIEAYMKGDNMPWAPLSRSWGANWQCGRNYCGKAISIKIVTSDKKVSISKIAGRDWAFGKTYVGQQVI